MTTRRALSMTLALGCLLAACATTEPEATAPTAALSTAPATLTVEVIAEQKVGEVRFVLFDSEEAYKSGNAVRGAVVDVTSGRGETTFQGLKPGTYAMRAFHDLNGNQTMDTNALGFPSEPFAFSNNARANFGPASFSAAAFEVRSGENRHTLRIK